MTKGKAMETTFSRDSGDDWDDGWSRAPHGLWTLDVPNGAKVLLGWLHSHSGAFLGGVTINQARRAVGSASIKVWFEALEAAGFVEIARRDNGSQSKITLKMGPWKALIGGRDRAKISAVTDPKLARTEEQGEDHHSSLREEELNTQVSDNSTGEPLDPSRALVKEYWDWYIAEHPGKKPTIAYLALVAVAKRLLKSGHEPDEIVDAMKNARAWTAKALSDEIARRRALAEDRASLAIPHAVVQACTKSSAWLLSHGFPVRDAMTVVARFMKSVATHNVGESMLRMAIAIRSDADVDDVYAGMWRANVDRFTGGLDDYPDAMERAYRNQYWRAT